LPNNFKFTPELFGRLTIAPWCDKSMSSFILTNEECFTLSQMTESSDGILLYRASRDGFRASAFHEKCDGKENTITIIKTDDNYVFGGYTSAKWSSNGGWTLDPTAFIFSLRRDGVSQSQKLLVTRAEYAIYRHGNHGPTFGGGHDFTITDRSDIHLGSYSLLGFSYQRHLGNEEPFQFLAGNYNKWVTTEIEVYQIYK
jgi:hypothetical protein